FPATASPSCANTSTDTLNTKNKLNKKTLNTELWFPNFFISKNDYRLYLARFFLQQHRNAYSFFRKFSQKYDLNPILKVQTHLIELIYNDSKQGVALDFNF